MSAAKRVLILGATGTIGRATAAQLVKRGHEVIAFARPGSTRARFEGAETRFGDPTDLTSLCDRAICGEHFDAVVSCLASRTGVPTDAWAVDYGANSAALGAAQASNIGHFTLLSAICVQKPRLDFQRAKLAFEAELQRSGLSYSIVRPTAFFKSLSGQVARVKAGKPFLMFGDGRLTACKPISDRDLGDYLVDTLEDPALQNRILPVGGPGPALTPRDQGEMLFALTGQAPRFKSVPPGLLRTVAGGLGALGRIVPPLRQKAALARIGHYYATESMLLWDDATGRYDADATPSVGTETLEAHYASLVAGEAEADLGAHAVF